MLNRHTASDKPIQVTDFDLVDVLEDLREVISVNECECMAAIKYLADAQNEQKDLLLLDKLALALVERTNRLTISLLYQTMGHIQDWEKDSSKENISEDNTLMEGKQ